MIGATILAAAYLGMCGATAGETCVKAPSPMLQTIAEHPTTLVLGICDPDGSCIDRRIAQSSYAACLQSRKRIAAAAIEGIRAECSTEPTP